MAAVPMPKPLPVTHVAVMLRYLLARIIADSEECPFCIVSPPDSSYCRSGAQEVEHQE